MGYIYEPKGRAREYGELALNLYSGCRHGCKYCYVPAVLRRKTFTIQCRSNLGRLILLNSNGN